MSADENKALVRRYLSTLWDRGETDAAADLLAAAIVRHAPPSTEGEVRGPAAFQQVVGMYRAAYPDLRIDVEAQVAEGDTVVTRWTARGTHRGELMGIAASGKSIAIPGVIIDR